MNGKIIKREMIDTDRKFWSVPVTIVSTVWEDGYHIYEADSAEEALEMYNSEQETPHEIEYTGWVDQEYRYDEVAFDEGEYEEAVEELNNGCSDVQSILHQEKARKEWLEEQAEKERRSKLI